MEIKYEHQNNSNYVVIEDDKEYTDYQFKMLRHNRPDHFLRISNYCVNGHYGIYYDVTSKQQLSKIYEFGKLSIEDVKSICMNISDMVKIAEDYMLDLDHVILEPRYIYMEIGTRKLYFIYHIAWGGKTFHEGLKELFEYILEHFDHGLDKQSVVKLYEVYQKVLVEDYDPYNLIRMFGITSNSSKVIENGDVENKVVVNEIKLPERKEIDTIIPEQIQIDVEKNNDRKKYVYAGDAIAFLLIAYGLLNVFAKQYLPFTFNFSSSLCLMGFGIIILSVLHKLKSTKLILDPITIIEKQGISYVKDSNIKEFKMEDTREMGNSYDEINNETILLSEYTGKAVPKTMSLILQDEELIGNIEMHLKNENHNIKVVMPEKYPFIIGSMEAMSDLVIGAQVISRMHCCLYRESKGVDNSYYVEDLNSKNSTFVNDVLLENHEKCELKNGDILKLAAISFKVEIS